MFFVLVVIEAFEIVRLFVNKTVVSKGLRRRGNPGYPRLQADRLSGSSEGPWEKTL